MQFLAAGAPARRTGGDLSRHVARFGASLADRWQDSTPDVVHANSVAGAIAVRAAASALGVPVLLTVSLPPATTGPADGQNGAEAAGAQLAAVCRSVDAVLVASTAELPHASRLGVPRASVSVVPLGVDVTRFTPAGPSASRDQRPRLLMLTDLADQQPVAVMLCALTKLPGAALVVAGGPARTSRSGHPGYRDLVRLARRLRVHDRVRWTGSVSQAEAPALLRSADVLVSLSAAEPFAAVPLEAMACGVPVVAAAAGLQQDAVIDGTTGFLVPPGQPAPLARRIRQLLASPMLREGCGIAAAGRARDRFSWARISQEMLACYAQLQRSRAEAA